MTSFLTADTTQRRNRIVGVRFVLIKIQLFPILRPAEAMELLDSGNFAKELR